MIWRYITIPQAVAGLAFLLPWMSVSVSNKPVADAAGWQLAAGRLPVHVDLSIAKIDATAAPHVNYLLVGALALIVVGLLLTLLSRPRPFLLIGSSILAFALTWAGTSRYSSETLTDAVRGKLGVLADLGAITVRVDWEWGLWVAVTALVLSGVMAWMAFNEARLGPLPPD